MEEGILEGLVERRRDNGMGEEKSDGGEILPT
jgi:hypothetical protein